MPTRRNRCSTLPNTKRSPLPKFLGRDRWLWLGLAVLAAGLIVRIALYFPIAMYQFDSDGVLSGLCAFRIAQGHPMAFFPGGSRLSAASCYVAAAYFHLVGPGRVGLALTGLTWSTLYLVFSLLFLRATLGPRLACLGLVFAAIPSEQFMTVTYAPWGYGEIMASCAATLWLAALWRNDGALRHRFGFGLSVGLGCWFSLQSLMIVIPAVAWIALRRRGRMLNEAVEALPGALVGATPLLVGNLQSNFATFTQNWASRPAPGISQFFDNVWWLLSYMLPKLLFRSSGWWSETTLLIVAYAVVAIGFCVALRRNAHRGAALLVGLVCAASILIFSASAAGSIRGWTVRYIGPLYLIVPVFCAIGIAALWRWSRWLAVICVAALCVPNLVFYGLPGSSLRSDLTAQLNDDIRLRAMLEQHRVRMVFGNYVWVYHLNFDSRERVAAIPFQSYSDYLNYAGRLGTAPVRWAAIGNPNELHGWAKAAGAHGLVTKDGALYVFVATEAAPNAQRLLAQLHAAPE